MTVEALRLRHGDLVEIDGGRLIVTGVQTRKSDRTVLLRFGWETDPKRLLQEDLVEVVRRDILPTAYGPRRSTRGG